MYASTVWLNDYLDPPASADEQAELLTRAGFPLEDREDVEGLDDIRQDFEMTSNRGDCTCHVGMAREIAALSGRTLKVPPVTLSTSNEAASDIITVTNTEPSACPRYTARIIRGITVGPSPDWLANRLRARGDIPRNNVVDATNFVLFELGQPTHVFDLATLRGPKIIIRRAMAKEPFLPLGEGAAAVELSPDDLVIADAERAVALAGVKGGAVTAVTANTTDVLVEAATFAPTTVRSTSRRHNIASDSSYRFERGVHPGMIDPASDRLCALILELCGGTLCEGIVEDGAPIPPAIHVSMRPARCRQLLGVDIDDQRMMTSLELLGFQPVLEGDVIDTTVPLHRLDIVREVDLIEEIARMYGMDHIPVQDMVHLRIAPPQAHELAKRAVNDALVGMGYVETITHSLVGESAAEAFLPQGTTGLRVDDERAKSEPVLRPSVVTSLCRVRKHNEDNGVDDLRLFETASTFHARGADHVEQIRLGLLADLHDRSEGMRDVRGVLDRLVEILRGPDGRVVLKPSTSYPWLSAGAEVFVDGDSIGWAGLLDDRVQKSFGLATPVIVADIDLHRYYAAFPPDTEARPLPSFPAIERDVSAILDDAVTWQAVVDAIEALTPEHLESVEFVTIFRGKQIPRGRKSLTMRLRFRANDHTLTHDDVDVSMDRVMKTLQSTFDAEIRS
ncbi:MAG: phenylalanine--tRNA ligase subunit beta [Phycisphaerales bacterium]|nr:phenylalanine--tRNA ligase subunit beta [Phycisphaerales bacterium]